MVDLMLQMLDRKKNTYNLIKFARLSEGTKNNCRNTASLFKNDVKTMNF